MCVFLVTNAQRFRRTFASQAYPLKKLAKIGKKKKRKPPLFAVIVVTLARARNIRHNVCPSKVMSNDYHFQKV